MDTESKFLRQFLQAVRPSFEKRMPSQMRKYLSNTSLPQVYASTKDVAEAKLKEHPGKATLSIDGHTDGNGRSVTTICILKPNVNVFYGLCWKRNERSTGKNLATMVENVMADYPDEMLGIVVDNTGNNLAMFEDLREKQSEELVYKYLLLVGCCVHLLDLLIEDICKISELDKIIKDANFMVTFVLEHKIFYEEFSILRMSRKEACKNIRTFSPTRFAHAYLMCQSVLGAFPHFGELIKSSVFQQTFAKVMRGKSTEALKIQTKFTRFRALSTNQHNFLGKLEAVYEILSPISQALHYGEGQNVPASHFYIMYQVILKTAKHPKDVVKEHISAATLEAVVDLIKDRWIPPHGSRKQSIKSDEVLAVFGLDPYALSLSPRNWFNDDVKNARTRVLNKMAKGDGLLEALFNTKTSEFQGHEGNVFSLPWQSASSTAKTYEENAISYLRNQQPESSGEVGDDMTTTIAVLSRFPSSLLLEFWSACTNDCGESWSMDQVKAHKAFCTAAKDVCSIKVTTCDTERFGKGFKLILRGRESLAEDTLEKLFYVYFNHFLCLPSGHATAPSFKDFIESMLNPDSEKYRDLKVNLSSSDP